MEAGLRAVLLGLLLGLQHATDPDHVVAVATIVSRTRRLRDGALVGAWWGLGHSATLGVVGAALLLLGPGPAPALGTWTELAVALMLVALGVLRIASAFRHADAVPLAHLVEPHPHAGESAFHSHPHAHGGRVHHHPHVHASRGLAAALRRPGAARALGSLLVGVGHGLAGSAAVALLALSSIGSPAGAAGFLAAFGAGTMLGMTSIAALLAAPFGARAPWLLAWQRPLALGTGVLCLAFGCYLAAAVGWSWGLR